MDLVRAIEVAKNLQANAKSPAELAVTGKLPKHQVFLIAYASFLLSISNENTRNLYKIVIDHFIRFLATTRGVLPLDTIGLDIALWREDLMKTGGILGAKANSDLSIYAPNTPSSIENRTSILSSFFKYLGKPGLDGSPPLVASNPVEALQTRFKIPKYGNSKKISLEVFRSILKQIDIKTIKGLRDYALLFGYFMTGRRNSEWVTLKWGNLSFVKSPPKYSFVIKGRKQVSDEMPAKLWEVLKFYLKTRWGENFHLVLRPESYLFTALEGRGGSRQKEDPNQPLTESYVLELIKILASKAGVDPESVTVHSIRHLHAQTYLESGASVEEVRARLKHQSLATTQTYVSTMEDETNKLADVLNEKLDLDPLS